MYLICWKVYLCDDFSQKVYNSDDCLTIKESYFYLKSISNDYGIKKK